VWKELSNNPATSAKEVYFAKLNTAGIKEGATVKLSNGEAYYASPKIVWTGNEYGVFWSSGFMPNANQNTSLFYRRVDATGAPLGDITTVISIPSYQEQTTIMDVQVVWLGDRYGVFWEKYSRIPGGTRTDINFFTADRFGTRLTPDALVISELMGRSSRVAWNGNGYGLVYEISGRLYFRNLNANGGTVIGPILFGNGYYPRITWDGSNYGITYVDNTLGWSWPVKFIRLNGNGTLIMGPISTLTSYGDPDLQWNGSEYGILSVYRSDDYHSQMILNTFNTGGTQTTRTQLAYYGLAWNANLVSTGSKFAATWLDSYPRDIAQVQGGYSVFAGVEQ